MIYRFGKMTVDVEAARISPPKKFLRTLKCQKDQFRAAGGMA